MENTNENTIIHDHCLSCINVGKCSGYTNAETGVTCQLVSCALKCSARFHECKASEHFRETCPHQFVDCLNRTYGCRLKIRRDRLSAHLESCVASVVRCGSYRVRKILNKNDKFNDLKWPDPIEVERQCFVQNDTSANQSTRKHENVNESLLAEDLTSMRSFARANPLRFHRLYGYLIGLNVSQDYSKSRFSFMQHLLKNVKSKVFKDIEAENCIVFNDEEGCSACQSRIRKLESDRFKFIKENVVHFFYVLQHCNDFQDFLDKKVYLNPEFQRVYDDYYAKVNDDESDKENKIALVNGSSNTWEKKTSELNEQERRQINDELLKNIEEILNTIELNPILQLNLTQEVPCEAFQLQYESYRIKDTNFLAYCDMILRRDEFASHYALHHNFLLPQAEHIDHACPFREYGCTYFQTDYDFLYGHDECHRYLNLEHPSADLVHNDVSNNLAFSLSYLYDDVMTDACHTESKRYDINRPGQIAYPDANNNENEPKSFMDLPYEVIFDIVDRLDSLSLHSLSMTSKYMRHICFKFLQTRGICYLKWSKVKLQPLNESEETKKIESKSFQLPKTSWQIDKCVYSFSKHIESPSKIKLKTNCALNKYNLHVQTCPFRRVRELTEPFRIYPHPHSVNMTS